MPIQNFDLHRTIPDMYMHTHRGWEIIYSLEGEGDVLSSSQIDPFRQGTIILQRPGVPHTKRSVDLFSDLFLEVDRLPIHAFEAGQEPDYFFQDTENQDFRQLMLIAYRYYLNTPRNELFIDNLYDAMLQLIVTWMEASDRRKTPEVQWIRSVIHERYHDTELDINSLLKQLNYDDIYLRKLFKAEVGESPNEYLRSVRIEHAKRILDVNLNTAVKTKDLALSVGYYDPNYFNRVFKAKTGMTPGEYFRSHNHTDEL